MPKATVGLGRVARSRLSGVAGTFEGLPNPGDIAEQICATAYTDGKTGGVFSASLDVLAKRLAISQESLTKELAVGISAGWLRQGTDRVELTASGIYVAKVVLNLPT